VVDSVYEVASEAPGIASQLFGYAKAANSMHSMATKVMGTTQVGVQQNTFGDSASCTNSGQGVTLDMFEDVRTVNPHRYCEHELQHSIVHLIRRPCLVTKANLTLDERLDILVTPFPYEDTPSEWFEGYLPYFMQFFRRWRGSLNYTFVWSASPLQSLRMSISLLGENDESYFDPTTGTTKDYVGNRSNVTFDIKGMGTKTLNVPYMSVTPWRYNWPSFGLLTPMPSISHTRNNFNSLPKITVAITQANQIGTNDTLAVLYVYVSAGPDFVMDSLQGPICVEAPVVEGQCDITRESQSFETFPGLPGPGKGAWGLTVEDMMKRWSSRGKAVATPTVYVDSRMIYWEDSDGTHQFGHFDLLAPLYKYNAGGISRKLFAVASSGLMEIGLGTMAPTSEELPVDRVSCGQAGQDLGKWPVIDFQVPYISYIEVDVHPRYWQSAATITNVIEAKMFSGAAFDQSQLKDQWVKASYNFQLMLLAPIMPAQKWPWALHLGSRRKRKSVGKGKGKKKKR